MTHPSVDPLWERLRREAEDIARREPFLEPLVRTCILGESRYEDALASLLSMRLAESSLPAPAMKAMFSPLLRDPAVAEASRRDLSAVVERDPAAQSVASPFLHFKGFQSLQAYRVSHQLWIADRRDLALYVQGRISTVFGLDFHPAAKVGSGILIDHGTGVVVGETAVIGDDVSFLQGVTLGGTGKETGDRHPKIGNGVLLGAGAKVLGNIKVGDCSKVGAGSVVLHEVPPHCTVVGVPARVVGTPRGAHPALDMDQEIEIEFDDLV
ncbi:MAG TPA: serine O-acetyltransferase [Fibrobacteria bacterium]|nr:serine O-acetyltransferase [Fibrobacteria bacterium]HOX50874.1 serine O-acetyltransferase [Fibrobacteria bacterium]